MDTNSAGLIVADIEAFTTASFLRMSAKPYSQEWYDADQNYQRTKNNLVYQFEQLEIKP